jgi:hypothetical protein
MEYAEQRELDKLAENFVRWQEAQNGSIQRIERKVDEIHKSQMDFYPAFYRLLDTEVDRRRCDDSELGGRIDDVESEASKQEKRIASLEVIAKMPSWAWKAAVAVAGLVAVILGILAITGVI